MSLIFKKINIEKCEKFPKDKVNIPSLIEDLEFIKVKRPFLYEELLNLKDENNKPYDLNDNSKENVANIQKRYFVVKAYEYLEKRFVENNISDEAKPYYLDRFEFELKIINDMKFDGYTLLVNDFLSTLNVKLGGLIGPGRGSSAGSLVSWAYGITNVDPMLDYLNTSSHLLFERYLNPERVSLPDIDMDMNGLINKTNLINQLESNEIDETTQTFLNIIKSKYENEENLDGKGLIEDYQVAIYGNDKVAKIVTRDTYQAKSSIAAVCRYLGNDFANEAGFKYKGTPYIELANKISGSAFTKPGVKFNDIFDVNSKFYNQYFINMYDSNYHVRTIVDLAKKLEGTIANYGVHAAGVLILDPKNNYTNDGYMVIGGTNVSVFDGKYVEDYINIKFDFLGLASLEEIDKTLKFIEKRYGKEKRDEIFKIINNENLLYNDKDIFRKVFDIQNTKKIFQFSSDGMQDLVKRIEPDNFDELVAITALYRPGPMESGMVDMYVKNKFNKEAVFVEFEELRDILEPTHQTIVFQESVMKIVQVLGGFSLGGADLVRRAMGKKIKEELDNLKGQFIEGVLKKYEGRHLTLNTLEQFAISQELILYYNGQDIEFKTVKEMNDLNLGEQFSEKEFGRLIIKKGEKLNISEDYITRLLANNLFENIIKFAGYGFNKSHAYAYTNVSMQMAYLKAHYPLEFFASIFVNNSDDIEKLTEYIVDGKKNGIMIYGVDINKSNLEFDTIDNKAIIYGLSNIKGISNKDIKTILKDREENGLYKSFSDFLLRFIKNHCSFKTLENLINVGAFDSLEFTQGVDLGKLVFDNALNRISITEDEEIYNLRLLNKSNYLKGLIDGKFDIFDNVEDTLQAKYIKFFEIEEKTHLLPFIITKTLKTKESTIKKIFNGKTDNAKIKFVSDIEESYIAMEELKGLIVVPKDLDKEENKRAFFTKVGKLFEINKFTEKQIEDIEEIYQNKKSLIKTSNIEFEATGSLSNIGSILVKDYVFKDDFIVPKLNLLLNPFDIEGDFFYKVVAKDIIKGENDEGDLYLSLVVLDVNGMETRFYFNNDQISRFKNNIEEGDPLIIEVNVKEGKNTFYKKIVNIEVLKESDNWKKYDCFKPRPLNIKQLDQDKIRQDFAKVDFCDLEQLAIDWRNSLNGWKGLSPDANRTLCFILSNYRVGVSSKTGNPYQIVSISDGLDNKSIDLFYFDVAESDLKNNLNKPILVELAKRNEKYGLGAGYKTKIEFLGDGYLKEEKSTKKVEEETFLEILDGREHINVYSKGRTLLGRKLSNFADIPTMVEIDGETIKFKNVESLWFYLKIYLTFGEKDTNLLDMEGYEAKEYGSKRLKLSRPLTTEEREYFIDIMKKGIEWKIRNNDALREEFKANYKKIPYAHYYNYSGNIITLPEHQWLVDFLNELEV